MAIKNDTAAIAATLAAETAAKAADLATIAATTATALASKTSETTAIISNDITWVKKSLSGIELTLKEMNGEFVSRTEFNPIHDSITEYHKKVDDLQQFVWIGIGGVTVLSFIIPIVLKYFIK
jgi:cob(I)alamin adenosyltransferase